MTNLRILSAVLLAALLAGAAPRAQAQANEVVLVEDERGWKLQVDGQDFMVFGMNWGYIPVGENYRYSLWDQSDEFIVEALDAEMSMLRDMGVNAIRLFSEIPPRWVEHIYDRYGIMTAVNHLMGRYGFEVNGRFVPETDYGDETTRRAILADLERTVEAYKDTRGVLMYLLGNENNYGLSWTSFEIEDLPEEADDPRAEYLYTLMGEGATLISGLDDRRPVALANGDINYLDVIARTCADVDIMGANVYRGVSSGDLFQRVRDEMGVPFVYTEFGADAWDAKRDREDDVAQAGYLLGQWREIYEQSYGKGGAGTALGGFIFQWSDGWWKFRQEENLDVHDTNASWATDAYVHDFVEGRNNMNEEWWGIAAKGPSDDRGFIPATPRTSYYVLQRAFRLDPYAGTTTVDAIRRSFGEIRLSDYSHRYATGRALDEVKRLGAVRLGDVRMRYESSISNGDERTERGPAEKFGHTESFWTDFEIASGDLRGRLSLHGVGAVGQNRLDNIFYENRALKRVVPAAGEAPSREPRDVVDRFAVYSADFTIERPRFTVEGFFRTGHFHWGYEGDFFGLYPEANYGPNLDTYNGQAPNGFEIAGKGAWEGWKVAVGPELWWGANPAVLAKYSREGGGWRWSVIHHEDLAEASAAQTSFAVPEQLNRRTTLYLAREARPLTLEVGGIFSGSTKVGDDFTWARETSGRGYLDSGWEVIDDEVKWGDTVGGRVRLTWEGALRWYGQGTLQGIVADGGYQGATLLTGWVAEGERAAATTGPSPRARRTGWACWRSPRRCSTNSRSCPPTRASTTTTAPAPASTTRRSARGTCSTTPSSCSTTERPWPANCCWSTIRRRGPGSTPGTATSARTPPSSPPWTCGTGGTRNAGTPTPSPWPTAPSCPSGRAPPAADEWEAKLHTVHNPGRDLRLVTTLLAGEGEPRGDDPRRIRRYGGDLRVLWRTFDARTRLRLDDWGPYDFHRDFNLTYPLQWYGDLSYGLEPAGLEGTSTRFGVRAQARTLDENSPEYVTDPADAEATGVELEVGLYVHIGL